MKAYRLLKSLVVTIARPLVLSAFVAIAAEAQNAPATTTTTTTTTTDSTAQSQTTAASQDQAVQLSPFQVNANATNGYRTDATTTGSKIATALVDLPLTVDVLDREFLDDTAVTGVSEAIKYVAGVSYMGQTGTYDTDQFGIRGFHTDEELRNGVYNPGVSDESNIERVEVVKGPAAVLYGIAAPGGLINYTTKQPFDTPQTAVSYTYGSWAYNKLDVDYNQPLSSDGSVLFRMPIGITDAGSNWKYIHDHKLAINPVLIFKPTKTLTINLDYQFKRQTGAFNRGGWISESFPALNGVPAHSTQPAAVYAPYIGAQEYGEAGPADTGNFERNYGQITVEQVLNRNERVQALFSYSALAMYDTGHFMGAQAYPQYQFTFNGSNLPPSDIEMVNDDWLERCHFTTEHYEVNFFDERDFGSWHNKFVGGLQGQQCTIYDIQFYYAGQFPSTFPAINAPDAQRFSFQGNPFNYVPWFSFIDPNLSEEFTNGVQTWGAPDVYFTDQLSGLDDKLHLLFGLRDQSYEDIHERKLVPEVGAIYAITKSISAYAVYSKSDISNGIATGGSNAGNPRPIQSAFGYDAGFKVNLLNDAIIGTIAYYDVVKNNIPYSDFSDFVGPGGKVIGGDEILGGQAESKGFEVELQIKPSANFQVEMQYAYDDGKDTKDGPIDLGANLPGAIPNSLTFLAKYHFSSGPLEGLEIGGGGRFTWGLTEYVLPSDVNFGSDNQPGPTRDLMAFIHYQMKIHGRRVQLAVGGKNLTNDAYVISNFTASTPRNYFASVSFSF